MTLHQCEKEAIGLCICLEAVDSIANHSLLIAPKRTTRHKDVVVTFHDSVHRDLFLIRFLDFAKGKGDKSLTGVDGSCLEVLKAASETKCFDVNGSITDLQDAVNALTAWLSHKKLITLWLPSLNINAKITVSRLEFLTITGNHCKHNLAHLTRVAEKVTKILNDHGYSISKEQIPLALDDFREHLAENYFAYYGTWMAELINNIRWGLQTYLLPIFHYSYQIGPHGFPHYQYEYPDNIQGEIARLWFWRLMNHVRSGPYLGRFEGSNSVKQESSLEWDK